VNPLDALASGGAAILGRPLTQTELESFSKYLRLLQKWQRVQRLVGSSDSGWIVEKLFLDSLLFLRVLPHEIRALADVGSGAGLPGIPIKIVKSELHVTLIESRAKRASFLFAAVRELGLANVEVVHGRIEDYGRDQPPAFDAAAMRCAGDFADLAPAAARLVRTGGLLVASGPPADRPLPLGDWTEVEGALGGSSRRFAVYRVT
jgi:16S rRNA (guanine527-N7)-methyltransferase